MVGKEAVMMVVIVLSVAAWLPLRNAQCSS